MGRRSAAPYSVRNAHRRKNMEPTSIKLFLVKGAPNSLRLGEISNWTGKAISAPRTELADFLDRPEIQRPGVYLLTGTDPESGDPALYIGEAEIVANRVKGHSTKDFWRTVTAFVSKDENLTKAHIRYLEGQLIELAKDASYVVLVNAAGSGSHLPEADTAEMDVFLAKILQLLPVLGITHFNKAVESPISEKAVLYCRIKGLEATGNRTSTGFIVYKGSQAALKHLPSAKHIRKIRDQLIEKGILGQSGNHLVFTRELEFGSPSTAGGVIRGG